MKKFIVTKTNAGRLFINYNKINIMKRCLGWLCFIVLFTATACKKESHFSSDSVATIQVINAINQEDVQLQMNGLLNSSGASNGASNESTLYYGTSLFYYADGKQTSIDVLRSNTTTYLFSNTYNFEKCGEYTLLLTGNSPNIESVLVDDTNAPQIDISKSPTDADSVIYFRFINLSPNVQPLDVKITGNASNEVSGLAYKGCSPWKAYPAKIINSSYQFQIIENGTVILTRNYSITSAARFKNVSIVIRGVKNGNPSLVAGLVNFYL